MISRCSIAGLNLSHGSTLPATGRPASHLAFHSHFSDTCRVRRRELSALTHTSKTSVKCHARPFTFRLVGWPKARPRHIVALVNVTSPNSLASACTITPGLLYTVTMKPCEVDENWICHQHVAPLSIEARLRSQASYPESSMHTTPQSKLAYLTCVQYTWDDCTWWNTTGPKL
jgi:hypothetical protein